MWTCITISVHLGNLSTGNRSLSSDRPVDISGLSLRGNGGSGSLVLVEHYIKGLVEHLAELLSRELDVQCLRVR